MFAGGVDFGSFVEEDAGGVDVAPDGDNVERGFAEVGGLCIDTIQRCIEITGEIGAFDAIQDGSACGGHASYAIGNERNCDDLLGDETCCDPFRNLCERDFGQKKRSMGIRSGACAQERCFFPQKSPGHASVFLRHLP